MLHTVVSQDSHEALESEKFLEDEALSLGARLYHERQDRKAAQEGFDRRDDVAKVIRGSIPIVAEGIRNWVDHFANQGKGRKPVGFKAIQLLDPDLLAYVGLSYTFRQIPSGGALTNLKIRIGRAVMTELEAAAIREADPKKARSYMALAEGEAKESLNQKRHDRIAEELEVSMGWGDDTLALTGSIIVGVILIKMQDVFERHRGDDRKEIIRLTDEAVQVLHDMSEAVAWTRPVYQPMLTPPRPWASFDSGCYEDVRLSRSVKLVRTYSKEHRRLVREAIAQGQMTQVMDAVNAIQDTRWAIDGRTYRMIQWVREQGLRPAKSFPASELPPMPRKATKEEWAAMTKNERVARARHRKAIKDLRQAASVDAETFAVDMELAGFLEEEGTFYIPHSLDWRSRVYAVSFFNFQRSDHIKALFRFADGVPLGADGADWLMIHLANCGDFAKMSKETFPDRIAWVREHELEILMYARDPEGTYLTEDGLGGWSKADSPFCFLQACFEYDAWMQSGFSQDFVSHIPIAADGSCSGLQHYAAITRSSKEAHHVNLVPRDTVGDIYRLVSEAALPTLQASASKGDEKAQRILELGFGRNDVKRNVMTYFYGSGQFGMRDQHMKDTMQPLADQVAMGEKDQHPYEFMVERKDPKTGEISIVPDQGFSCAHALAAHTYQAVVAVAPMADEAATWIQTVAGVLAHESQPMVWRTPTGMPVVQRYSEYTSKIVNMWLYDRKVLVPTGTDRVDHEGNTLTRVRLLVREAPTKRINKRKMRSAASPNVIHSMDGSHLQLSVVRAKEEGIHHFAMIHDSFGTHAGNMTIFSRVIREAFVEIYEDYCPLKELDDYARTVLSEEGVEKLPPIPTKGDLELGLIRHSLYAFA